MYHVTCALHICYNFAEIRSEKSDRSGLKFSARFGPSAAKPKKLYLNRFEVKKPKNRPKIRMFL